MKEVCILNDFQQKINLLRSSDSVFVLVGNHKVPKAGKIVQKTGKVIQFLAWLRFYKVKQAVSNVDDKD